MEDEGCSDSLVNDMCTYDENAICRTMECSQCGVYYKFKQRIDAWNKINKERKLKEAEIKR